MELADRRQERMKMEDLGIGWMDLLIVTLLIVGLFRGRKRGMSEEFLDVVKWGLILGIGSFCYAPVGGIISSSTPFSRLFSYVATYMAVILIVTLLFSLLRKQLGGKLIGSDTFAALSITWACAPAGCATPA